MLIHLPAWWKAPQFRDAFLAGTAEIPPHLRAALTWDQGSEMALHAEIAARAGFESYFCDPHSPWQRGTNQNTNGLLRRYFPKGSNLSVHTLDHLKAVARQLNNRPRMVLGDLAPAQAMRGSLTSPITH
ncbi:IS30 family transposase [Pseudonocardia artemisiae]